MDNNSVQDANDAINEKMKTLLEFVGHEFTLDGVTTVVLHGKVIDREMFYLVGAHSKTIPPAFDVKLAVVLRGKINLWHYKEEDKLDKLKILHDEFLEIRKKERQQEKKIV
jgi:hypothetical protein